MDTRQTDRFLARLYEDGDRFEVAFIQVGGKVARTTRAYDSESLPRVIDEMERAEGAGFNVYASALPVSRQQSKVYDRVWVDQDDPSAPWPFGSDPRWEASPWPMPTTLVRTSDAGDGFRWQAIWLLQEELPEDEARDMMKRLAAEVGGDGAVHDPRRVLRVPGILNAKRGSMARIIDTRKERVSVEAFNPPEVSAIDALMSMEVVSPQHILGEWLKGVTEGDRSRKAYIAARFLKGCGVEFNDAAGILKLGALRCDPVFEDHELDHVLSSAFLRPTT